MKGYLQPILVRHKEGSVIGIIWEVFDVKALVHGLFSDIGIESLQVVSEFIGAIRESSVPLLLTPWVSQPHQSLFFLEIFAIIIKNFHFYLKDIDNRVRVAGKDTTIMSFWLLNLFFSSTKSRAPHHWVLIPELLQFMPKSIFLPFLESLHVFTFLLSIDLDLPTSLLPENDFGSI